MDNIEFGKFPVKRRLNFGAQSSHFSFPSHSPHLAIAVAFQNLPVSFFNYTNTTTKIVDTGKDLIFVNNTHKESGNSLVAMIRRNKILQQNIVDIGKDLTFANSIPKESGNSLVAMIRKRSTGNDKMLL